MFALIADEHPLLRKAVKQIIESSFPEFVIWEASTGEDALHMVREVPVELAVLDIMLPDDSGLTVLKQIKQLRPKIKCVILTIRDEPQYVRVALSHGASGYLTKESTPDEFCEAVRVVVAGGQYVTERLRETLDVREDGETLPHHLLSLRELEVLALLGKGRNVSRVATQLRLSVKTVSTYRYRLLEKLRLETTADLIRYAIEHRLVR